MKKYFNVDGVCFPDEHYMVNIDERVKEIRELVDAKKYFVINRARQYGKTTTIHMLSRKLVDQYAIFSISFEGMLDAAYVNESAFCRRIFGLLYDTMYYGEVNGISEALKEECRELSLERAKDVDFRRLSNFISSLCAVSERPVVLIIDEVDQASNQSIFLGFLGMLRDKYLKRKNRPTFQSVILAGVYDIKNLKLKIRSDAGQQYNSPWNIAARFPVNMSFSVNDIAGMLREYELDNNTGMDIDMVAKIIFEYTAGYPFLVSYISKAIDEHAVSSWVLDEHLGWTKDGIVEAVKVLLKEPNTLFEDMTKHLVEYPELSRMLQNILFSGRSYPYNAYNQAISIGTMFGFIIEKDGNVCISNRIFETHMYNYFLSEEISENRDPRFMPPDKNQFTHGCFLDMDLVMEKFMEHYSDIYRNADACFLEENARRLFLLYLKPIINGVGNYYIEARTRDQGRTDIIVDYHGKQYIIEMKIYRGEEYNRKGEKQLSQYLDAYHLTRGYLLCFNFNKNKRCEKKEISIDGKTILEIIV